MNVCNFDSLNSMTLECAKKSIRKVIADATGVFQYDSYFRTTREIARADDRLIKLLNIVSGWSMNRNRQCTTIIEKIADKKISIAELESFWKTVDTLPNIELRDLPNSGREQLRQIEMAFDEIRKTLRGWHSSSDSLCFLTKVILMFNWGQSPAFDKRIRSVLKMKNNITNKDLVTALVEIGYWIQRFESKHGVKLDTLATNEMNGSNRPLPLGRSFDMMLFYLEENS